MTRAHNLAKFVRYGQGSWCRLASFFFQKFDCPRNVSPCNVITLSLVLAALYGSGKSFEYGRIEWE